ncbi:HAD family hydrolase [Thermomonas sp.]|uniref:HAD family hydrolase n=1 Tax=Thermomonas sp. TaxID=1971895 RepID=UPI0031BDAB57|nr:hypothetical protein [Rhodanobacteraceae bacterium]
MASHQSIDIQPEETITVSELGTVLDRFSRIKLLSLDCFDTILWRKVAHPADVFYTLQASPAWQAIGLDAQMRALSETMARKLATVRRGSSEVSLEEICKATADGLTPEAIAALQEAELQAEIDACRALPEAVALIRDAARRGIKVMIVSDMYLREPQLRRLLQACLPEDAYAAIGRVAVSCDYDMTKGGGLIKHLIQRFNLPAAGMLHIGDNPTSDWFAARAAGIRGLHLRHLPAALESRLQHQSTVLRLLEPDVRSRRPMPAGYHTVQAAVGAPVGIDQEVGYTTLGPMMHAFASWLRDCKQASLAQGRKVKMAFLLRDGYMPCEAYRALTGDMDGKPVYISRFAAFAASFRNAEDVERYLAIFSNTNMYAALLKQLGICGDEAKRIIEAVKKHKRPQQELIRQVLLPKHLEMITTHSAAYRARLKTYLESELGLARGDTLVFVDLGYVGNAQRVLAPMMHAEWGVDLHGWYFMCTPMAGTGATRLGMIDSTRYDPRTIATLLPFVSLLESLSTTSAGSVVDYGEDGSPILSENATGKKQTEKVVRIQQHALDFIRQAEARYVAGDKRPCTDDLRDAALAEFARMVFFPDREELAHYDQFALELNMGTDRVVRLHDTDRSLAELRRHGLFYAARNNLDQRINTPHELRHAGLEMTLSMLASYRYGLLFRAGDWTLRAEPLTALLLRGENVARLPVKAVATYDGCYRVQIPLGTGDTDVGLLFGDRHQWLQLVEARVLRLGELVLDSDFDAGTDVRNALILDGMQDHGNGLLECTSNSALVMLPAGTATAGPIKLALDIVFRPLVGLP